MQDIENEVLLTDIENKQSSSIKELKSFDDESQVSNGDDLIFDSRFESGNLHSAFRKKQTHEYHLFMSNDTNTMGYNQWFYFSIRNTKKSIKYSFQIMNYVLPLRPRENIYDFMNRDNA